MDSSKFPVPEVLLKESSPLTFTKQYYSLPSPIIKYMLENASAINYFKLFQTCKILQKFIQEKYGPQIDVLEVGNFNHDSYFFTIHARNKEIKIRGSSEIYNKFPKNQKLWLRKRLMFKNLSKKVTSTYFEKLNFSTVKEVYLLYTNISIEDYKKLLVTSIEVIYFYRMAAAEGFDIISYTLKHLPNLKSFTLPWNPNLTTFDELTAIKRSCKLKKAEIYLFDADFDKKNLSEFIPEHMAPEATLCLRFAYGVPKTVKQKYQNFANEFNKISNKVILKSARIFFE